MTALVLGPVLRHIGATDATIWVETDGPCMVTVRTERVAASERTFRVAEHFYAVVVLTGLAAGATLPYSVDLDDATVWPMAGSRYPPSLIRTIAPDAPLRILFGSCRSPVTVVVRDPTGSGNDVLGAYARRMAGERPEDWPQLLLMLGDQVYADETSDVIQDFLRRRRDVSKPPGTQVADFEEYTRLYWESWGDADVRWLLSTLPSSMIFDDHDVLDDWNTSASWRRDMQATAWWQERITGALMSYWVYQHLGNLSPAGLGGNALFQAVLSDPDAQARLRAFARAADREADGGRTRCGPIGATSDASGCSSSTRAAGACWRRADGRW